ncbi:cysteine-rich CWC family protein [Mariprofundus micogutta]|uniref:cysteine-rich CWC family protein n=1 Tax=Mariprofundus micogutta TaxID=1921010 RepID=UPI001D12BE94
MGTAHRPLCGQLNHCAMADTNTHPDSPCWCRYESFPQALLDQVPQDAKNRVCICKDCLNSFRKSELSSDPSVA